MTGWIKRQGLILPAGLMVFLFIVLPYLNVILMSLRTPSPSTPYGEGYSIASYIKLLSDSYYMEALAQSLFLGALTAIVCLVLSFPVALHLLNCNPRWRALLYGIVLSPLLVGIVVRSYGWTILLGNAGMINSSLMKLGLISHPLPLMYNYFGIVVALAHVFLPFMILPLLGSLQSIDPAVYSAARSLGASRFTVFRRILLPQTMPGIQSGMILVFVLALSAYVTPVLVGGMRVKTMAVIVVETLIDQFQWPFGSALALFLAAAASLVILIFSLATRMKWK